MRFQRAFGLSMIVAACFAPASVLMGQLTVPLSECTCGPPTDIDPRCNAGSAPQTCTRGDSQARVIADGVENVAMVSTSCRNCDGCPCTPPPTMNCGSQASVSQTTTATSQIDSRITIGIPGIEAGLGSALGAQIGFTLTVTTTAAFLLSGRVKRPE